MSSLIEHYPLADFFDELVDAQRQPRPAARALFQHLEALDAAGLDERREAVNAAIMTMGITFTVYSEAGNIDRAWPFDIIPRVMAKKEWDAHRGGPEAALTALNLFINDLYNEQRIVKDGVFPIEVLDGSKNFRDQCGHHAPFWGLGPRLRH
jgi:uncharacterized circularly permuted ATP-grasp superfamily protein